MKKSYLVQLVLAGLLVLLAFVSTGCVFRMMCDVRYDDEYHACLRKGASSKVCADRAAGAYSQCKTNGNPSLFSGGNRYKAPPSDPVLNNVANTNNMGRPRKNYYQINCLNNRTDCPHDPRTPRQRGWEQRESNNERIADQQQQIRDARTPPYNPSKAAKTPPYNPGKNAKTPPYNPSKPKDKKSKKKKRKKK